MTGDQRPGARRDEQEVRRFVEVMARLWADWGFPRMAARVLMALMAADEEALTAAELGERLGVSPAAISGGVRYLAQLGLIVREPVPGSRRDGYRLPGDAWYQVGAVKNGFYKVVVDQAGDGLRALGPGPAHDRIADMRDFFQFLMGEIDGMLDRWEAHRASSAGLARDPD